MNLDVNNIQGGKLNDGVYLFKIPFNKKKVNRQLKNKNK